MKLYHFCPEWMLQSILREGLTRGSIPALIEDGGIKLVHGFQWLTTNSDFDQSWCRHSRLPYKRNEVRLTVKIPERAIKNVQRWLQYCADNPNPYQDDLNCYGDPENWVLYRGSVNPLWIKKFVMNQLLRRDDDGKGA